MTAAGTLSNKRIETIESNQEITNAEDILSGASLDEMMISVAFDTPHHSFTALSSPGNSLVVSFRKYLANLHLQFIRTSAGKEACGPLVGNSAGEDARGPKNRDHLLSFPMGATRIQSRPN